MEPYKDLGDEQAFPAPITERDAGAVGLTKREWFIGQALAGLHACNSHGDLTIEVITRQAKLSADDVIDALEQDAERDRELGL